MRSSQKKKKKEHLKTRAFFSSVHDKKIYEPSSFMIISPRKTLQACVRVKIIVIEILNRLLPNIRIHASLNLYRNNLFIHLNATLAFLSKFCKFFKLYIYIYINLLQIYMFYGMLRATTLY